MLYLLVQTEVAEGIGGQCLPAVFQSRGGKEGDTDHTLSMCWDHLGIQEGENVSCWGKNSITTVGALIMRPF